MAADFKAKDEVYIVSLRKLGKVLGKKREGYEVSVGGLVVQCAAKDLKPRAELSRDLVKTLSRMAKPVAGSAKSAPTKPLKLDLHGMRVEDAMRCVEKAMNRAIMEEYSRMEIVHGIGEGKIRAALHRYLATIPTVESFRLDDQNAGVTWVYF
jgi:DNA mismatch repair protein MutS2